MADEQHATLLRRSVREWNRWRVENPQVTPDLAGAGLRGLDLSGANLSGAADLRGAVLSRSSLAGSRPTGANLFKAVLDGADLDSADLRGVRFLDCAQLATARNWQWAHGNADLECGVPIPQRPGALVRAPQASTSRGRSIVLINIVTRCVSRRRNEVGRQQRQVG